jgi:site-specific DNA recombinase
MNEMFLDDMIEKVHRGQKGQILRGYSAGGRVYGYKRVQILSPDGQIDQRSGRILRLGVKMEIDENEAEVIREIFRLRRLNLGYRAIADQLNQRGIPSPHADTEGRSGFWCINTIR